MIIKISWREYPDKDIKDDDYDDTRQNQCEEHISTLKGFKKHYQYHTCKEYYGGMRIVNMIFEFDDSVSFVMIEREIKRHLNVKVI